MELCEEQEKSSKLSHEDLTGGRVLDFAWVAKPHTATRPKLSAKTGNSPRKGKTVAGTWSKEQDHPKKKQAPRKTSSRGARVVAWGNLNKNTEEGQSRSYLHPQEGGGNKT